MEKTQISLVTGLLHSSKLVHLDIKNFTSVTQNLVYNLIKINLSSKSNPNWPKMAKTETLHKTRYVWHLGLRVNRQVKHPRKLAKDGPFVFFFFSLFNAKRLPMKSFLEVTLVSITLRRRTVFLKKLKHASNLAFPVCYAATD